MSRTAPVALWSTRVAERFARARQRRPSKAVALAVLAYVIGYGFAVEASIAILLAPPGARAASEDGRIDLFVLMLPLVTSVVLEGAAAAWAGGQAGLREWGLGRREQRTRTWWASSMTLGLVALATTAGAIADIALDLPVASTGGSSSSLDLFEVLVAVQAGVGEELVVLAAPVVALRYVLPQVFTSRRGLVAVTVGLTVARLLYHLYYGWGAITLIPWAVVSVVVYLAWGRVWPLIVLHVAHDLLNSAAEGGVVPVSTGPVMEVLVWLVFLGLALWFRKTRSVDVAGG